MANLFELKAQRAFAQNKAENILAAAEAANRTLTDAENADVDLAMAAVKGLDTQIGPLQRQSTLREQFANGMVIPAGGHLRQARTPGGPIVLSNDYYNDFNTWIGTRGQQIGASLYEGSGSSGGYVVPTIIESQIVPLAPLEMGVRSIAMVVPTASDIKIPIATAFGGADGKLESGGSDNYFTESDPTLNQFTLSAYMTGTYRAVSFELAQDVPSFNQFIVKDVVLALQMLEEGKFVNGSGTGEAQGLIGNVGTGITGVAAGSDGYGSELLDASFDIMGKLNAAYHPGAGWLMNRATGVVIRKAQKQANLFAPVWTREAGRDYLHGYPVTFSASMPSIYSGHTPVLFGNFSDGYLIGDRGGAGINIKILDQPKALEGQIVILGYRRNDGRVRRSEAIQAITLA